MGPQLKNLDPDDIALYTDIWFIERGKKIHKQELHILSDNQAAFKGN